MIAPMEHIAGSQEVTIGIIESKAKSHSTARTALAEELDALREELNAVQKTRMRSIKLLAGKTAMTEAELYSAIECAGHLFTKPRTLTLHGIKVGFREGKGKIVFDDAETVVKLIKKFFADKTELLIHTAEAPNKDGLKILDEKELKSIGCRTEGLGDQVVLKPADDEIEKQIAGLINKMVETMLDEKEQL